MMNILSSVDIHTGWYSLFIVCQYVSCHEKYSCPKGWVGLNIKKEADLLWQPLSDEYVLA